MDEGDEDEDEDEETVIYDPRNGFTLKKRREDFNRNKKTQETIEMTTLSPEEEELVKLELVSVKVKKVEKLPCSWLRTGCFVGSLVLVVCFLLIFLVILPLLKKEGYIFIKSGKHDKTAEWVKAFEDLGMMFLI